ncbi:hypothetical protein EYB45_02305 [Erythrobacteraceae bacterium CFH 75059]|uniref:PilZ domain-containing protein n=1 Tax=Qipengyuania thermophila TaxID=2509361 RepID=UPI00102077F3|nr:PilZ domain-containing protein [Qipengyuania thermophila]TCD06566.1 hypothetical protein EYB45_02305 [Erythrobacteraceae bacterium CFH 75059]
MADNSPSHIGRRDHQRLRLKLAASLITVSATEPVLLLDLSQTGARIATRAPLSITSGFLRWLRWEMFGDVVWEKGPMIGLRFDEKLPLEVLLSTRREAPDESRRHADDALEHARAWAAGGSL